MSLEPARASPDTATGAEIRASSQRGGGWDRGRHRVVKDGRGRHSADLIRLNRIALAAQRRSAKRCIVRDDPTLAALVARAAKGDQNAWDELVERFAPLVWSICRRYSLERADVDDVAQNVWLKLVEALPAIREPNALPGWLATTTQRECLRLLRVNQRLERRGEWLAEETSITLPPAGMIEEEILKAEWDRALVIAFGQLPLPCRELLSLLMQEPPVPYTEVSRRLGIPVGGIGPRRARCLAKLRRCQPLADLLGEEDNADGRGDESGG